MTSVTSRAVPIRVGDRLGKVADDLAVDLLEQVVAQQVPEARILDRACVVQVARRSLCQGCQCLLAVPIVAETGEVELDVAESAGSFGLQPGGSLPEHPQPEVVDARVGDM